MGTPTLNPDRPVVIDSRGRRTRWPVRTLAERLWPRTKKLTVSGCWEWQGFIDRKGYGRLRYERISHLCHRLAWELTYGPIPAGLCVCHHCDNRLCVRPDHLFLGTIADNNHDMVAKGRVAAGEHSGQARLTVEEVIAIRGQYRRGTWGQGYSALARRYGVSMNTIRSVVLGRTWRAA